MGSTDAGMLHNSVRTFTTDTAQSVESESSDIDTWIYPLVQMGPFGITTDDSIMQALFRNSVSGSKIFLASGYFNLTDHYMDVILEESKANYELLMASPEVCW